MNPAILTSIFKSLGIDPNQFKEAWEGFTKKIDHFDMLLNQQTVAINNLSAQVELLRQKIDPDAVGDTPIANIIAEKLEATNGESQG